jgi:methionyl-tRNA formyltransferase
MRVGIISDSDSFIPLAIALVSQQQQVSLFYSLSPDAFINQKVQGFVKQTGIPLMEEKNSDIDLYHWLLKEVFDVCFVIGYKHLIRLDKLTKCPTQLFNIHFGPLPSFKGPVPVFWQLKQGHAKIGLSIHRLSSKYDEGEVVWIKETDNLGHYNYKLVNQLFSQLCVEGVFFIVQLVMNILPLPIVDRTAIAPAYQKRPGLNEVMIDWRQMDAIEIGNLVRACNPWNKGAITFYKGTELKLMDATIISNGQGAIGQVVAGAIVNDKDCLHIQCRDGKVLNVNMLFYQDCFIPAYHVKHWGFVKGEQFVSP